MTRVPSGDRTGPLSGFGSLVSWTRPVRSGFIRKLSLRSPSSILNTKAPGRPVTGASVGVVVELGEATGVGPGGPTWFRSDKGLQTSTPTMTTAIVAAAPTASFIVDMVRNLHGTRIARRCLIDGKAARTTSSA